MKTPYLSTNAEFSDAAHKAAQNLIYPEIFKGKTIEFASTQVSMGGREAILDGEMAVDRIIKVHSPEFKGPIEFTSQERFRKPSYAQYQDLTITEWNQTSNLPSELYKIKSGLFVYGYYNPSTEQFVDWIAADTTLILFNLISNKMAYTHRTNHRSNQTFVCLTFEQMRKAGVIVCEMSKTPDRRTNK